MAFSKRHDHGSMGSMDGGDDMMSMGTISVHAFPKIYWAFVGAVIAAFTVRNIVEYLICRQRLAAAKSNRLDPARPSNILTLSYATLTAAAREISNVSLPPLSLGRFTILSPALGSVGLVLAYLALLLVLCFYQFDTRDYLVYEQIAFRAGFVSLAQIPLLFLLAGKNNFIGCLTGHGYERLNYLHRWTARGLLMTVTIHLGYWFSDWAPYGNYIQVELTTYKTATTGFVCWVVLLWIVLSSFAPIRGWSYEFFVVQHVISFVAFVAMVFIHVPMEEWGWLWAAVAVYFTDRVSRALWMAYTNLAIFHARSGSGLDASGLWSCHAELQPLPHGMTRMTVHDPPITWSAGQHAFVSCNTVIPLQSHPFTIASLSDDQKMEFVVKAQAGGTKRLLRYAEKMVGLPNNGRASTVPVVIQGPFGKMRPLRQFDSVVLVAGSTGATFTTPLLRDLIVHMGDDSKGGLIRLAPGAVTRHIRYVWVVKSRKQLSWFTAELNQAVEDMNALKKDGKKLSLDISIYITCDPEFTKDRAAGKEAFASGVTSTQQDRKSQHGIVEQKRDIHQTTIDVEELDPRGVDNSSEHVKTCGPDNTCCCQMTIDNEEGVDGISRAAVCNCCNPGSSAADSSSGASLALTASNETPSLEKRALSTTDEKKGTIVSLIRSVSDLELHPSIPLLSGRPHTRNIICTVLEQARGESGVVVCGPRSLNDRVRADVVALSDERAVHKGTGAQGIWFHSEGFGW